MFSSQLIAHAVKGVTAGLKIRPDFLLMRRSHFAADDRYKCQSRRAESL